MLNDPRIRKFSKLELLARQVVEGFITGLHRSPFHGFSVEFAEHRQYNTGESTRHIDWKLYGRTEKMFVKRYEEETNLRCHIVIDTSSSMRHPEAKEGVENKLSFSIHAAAAIMQLMKRQRDAVGLSLFSDDLDLLTDTKSSQTHHRYLYAVMEQLLEDEKESHQTDAAKALHKLAEGVHKRSLVIIFSDMFDTHGEEEIYQALQHIKHNKNEVLLFHVTDKKSELDFDFENRPYEFVDRETGEKVKLNPSGVKEAYLEKVASFEKELKLRCAQLQIDLVEADVSQGFDKVLLDYLVKRKKLH